MITAAQAREFSYNTRVGFIKLVEYHLVDAASKGKVSMDIMVPSSVWDAIDEIRARLTDGGYAVTVETRQGCCLPDEKVMLISWQN